MCDLWIKSCSNVSLEKFTIIVCSIDTHFMYEMLSIFFHACSHDESFCPIVMVGYCKY